MFDLRRTLSGIAGLVAVCIVGLSILWVIDYYQTQAEILRYPNAIAQHEERDGAVKWTIYITPDTPEQVIAYYSNTLSHHDFEFHYEEHSQRDSGRLTQVICINWQEHKAFDDTRQSQCGSWDVSTHHYFVNDAFIYIERLDDGTTEVRIQN